MSINTSFLWKIPLLLFLLYLPFSSTLDLKVASFFLGPNERFKPPQWCLVIYTYGLLPGQLLFLVSVAVTIASCRVKSIAHLRWPCIYLSTTLLVGSLLFGHVILKQFWPRPRPKQVVLYGGKYPYKPLLTPYIGPSDRFLRSLPSGHATMGFYFFSLYFLGKRLSRRYLAMSGLLASATLGSLLSWARLAQGGHFLSDIIVSGIIMWMSAYWLDRYLAQRLTERK